MRRFSSLLPNPDLPGAKQKTPFNMNRYILLIITVIWLFITSCVFLGWPSLTSMLYKSGAYEWVCEKDKNGRYINDQRILSNKKYICDEQDTKVQPLLTITTFCSFLMAAFGGCLVDIAGPKLTGTLGQLFLCLSWLSLAFSSKAFEGYYIAFCFMGFGAGCVVIPTVGISRLFPDMIAAVITVTGAAQSASYAIPVILDSIYNSTNISFKELCLYYLCIGPLSCAIIAFFLFPSKQYEGNDRLQYNCNNVLNGCESSNINNNVDEENKDIIIINKYICSSYNKENNNKVFHPNNEVNYNENNNTIDQNQQSSVSSCENSINQRDSINNDIYSDKKNFNDISFHFKAENADTKQNNKNDEKTNIIDLNKNININTNELIKSIYIQMNEINKEDGENERKKIKEIDENNEEIEPTNDVDNMICTDDASELNDIDFSHMKSKKQIDSTGFPSTASTPIQMLGTHDVQNTSISSNMLLSSSYEHIEKSNISDVYDSGDTQEEQMETEKQEHPTIISTSSSSSLSVCTLPQLKTAKCHVVCIPYIKCLSVKTRKQIFFETYKITCSLYFIGILIYFVVSTTTSTYYMLASERTFSQAVIKSLSVCLPFAFVPCIMLGFSIDIFGIMPILTIVNLGATFSFLFALFTTYLDASHYISVIFYCVARSVQCSQVFCFLEQTFPSNHFGKLSGIILFIGGSLSFVCIPIYNTLVVHTLHGKPFIVSLCVTCVHISMFAVLAYLWILKKKKPRPFDYIIKQF